MLKSNDSVNVEGQARDALARVLSEVPGLDRVDIQDTRGGADASIDFLCRLVFQGREQLLAGEVNSSGQPRHIQGALFQLKRYLETQSPGVIPLVVAPYLSERVRDLCVDSGASYLDLQGNARIVFPGFFLFRETAGKPANERREMRSLFKPKSAAVLRCMLRQPARAWRVSELSSETSVSLGHVSNVRTSLLDREWAEVSEGGLRLSQPDALLDAWRDAYEPPAAVRQEFYTTLHGATLDDVLRAESTASSASGHAILSGFSAARWLAPYGRTSTCSFYADAKGADHLRRVLGLVAAGRGSNVEIAIVEDTGLLRDAIEPASGIHCTSVVQTYLDLCASGERGQEAAEHLRRERLRWQD
ncbi:type IV toxin-antitoxin system AbiEi family antitoxin [Roseateles sp. So40a]|uniref:type IV toxin-antitoxin system AbiEi family antitoxin n=1 Tax=Roseateles sp. So40a TaxID=3400226 RepID=UPI003A891391